MNCRWRRAGWWTWNQIIRATNVCFWCLLPIKMRCFRFPRRWCVEIACKVSIVQKICWQKLIGKSRCCKQLRTSSFLQKLKFGSWKFISTTRRHGLELNLKPRRNPITLMNDLWTDAIAARTQDKFWYSRLRLSWAHPRETQLHGRPHPFSNAFKEDTHHGNAFTLSASFIERKIHQKAVIGKESKSFRFRKHVFEKFRHLISMWKISQRKKDVNECEHAQECC